MINVQREAVVQLHISKPLLTELLKLHMDIEIVCIENKNKNRKRQWCGKDADVEKVLKELSRMIK